MDESGTVFYSFPPPEIIDQHREEHPPTPTAPADAEAKQCSVRGCTQILSPSTKTKMCEACRGRHRIYATTKRARRKLEKAVVAGSVNGNGHVNDIVDNIPGARVWMPPSVMPSHEGSKNGSPSPHEHGVASTPASTATPTPTPPSVTSSGQWEHAIDPRLIITTSTSELAGALTLPTPSTTVTQHTLEPIVSSPQHRDSSASPPPPPPHTAQENEMNEDSQHDESDDPKRITSVRVCSVKGCKTFIPPGYTFKMCEHCRDRYRIYGNTKRAKWKAERMAFDKELADLRVGEDERRRKEGLVPLSESPEELRKWELSIINEQLLLTPGTAALADAGSGALSPTSTPVSPNKELPAVNGVAGMVMMQPTGTIDSPHAISPYAHLGNSTNADGTAQSGSLPARMCTVSHCHKILPGFYRYKRCEQHRLQNRYHSKLKRVREKGDKSGKGGKDEEESSGSSDEDSGDQGEGGGKEEGEDKTDGEKGKGKEKEKAVRKRENESSGQSWFVHVPTPPGGSAAATRCIGENCCNLLKAGVRWRMCEKCRVEKREKSEKGGVEKSGNDGVRMDVDHVPDNHAPSLTQSPDSVAPLMTKSTSNTTHIQPIPATFITPTTDVPLTSTANLQTIDAPLAPLTFRAYKPKTAASTVGRLIAQNRTSSSGGSSTHVLTDMLVPKNMTASDPKLSSTSVIKDIRVFVPTVPKSAPFVYQPPAKANAKKSRAEPQTSEGGQHTMQQWQGDGKTGSEHAKSGSGSGSNGVTNTTSSSREKTRSSTSQPPHFTPPAGVAPYAPSYPYGAPMHPQYPPYGVPYYMPPPYGMPPYGMAPPPNHDPSSSSSSAQAPSPSPPTYAYPPPNHFAYAPQPYPYQGQPPPPPPHGYAYMPPGYMPGMSMYGQPQQGGYMAAPMQHLQPGTYPAPYSYGKDAAYTVYHPFPPVQAQTRAHGQGQEGLLEKERDEFGSFEIPRKRRKKKIKEKTKPVEDAGEMRVDLPLVSSGDSSGVRAEVAPAPQSHPDHQVDSAGTVISTDTPMTDATINEAGVSVADATEAEKQVEGSLKEPVSRLCGNKTCRRLVSTGLGGTLCERCKMRMKKHQAKTKARFKLEPRKSLLGTVAGAGRGEHKPKDDAVSRVDVE